MNRNATRHATRATSILGIGLTLALLASAPAEARRGGSFGSRGMRTYSAPRYTPTAPRPTAPIQRSMTAPPAANPGANPAANAARPAAQAPAPMQQPRRGGMFGGFAGGLLGGLVAGGLMGMLLGHGWGGFGAGFANTLMQLALVALVAFVAISFLRRRREPAPAAATGYGRSYDAPRHDGPAVRDFPTAAGGTAYRQAAPEPTPAEPIEIGLTGADREAFERLLSEVQSAFGREDYAALRERTTPEIMSYLSEELSQNAVAGRRNDVSQVRLLQADIAEAWAEGDADYATAAMRYESIDVMRDRQSGAVLEGDAARPTETTELWTFVRHQGGAWKLSAIQEA